MKKSFEICNPILEGLRGIFQRLQPADCDICSHEPEKQSEAVRGFVGSQHYGWKDFMIGEVIGYKVHTHKAME